MSLLRKWWMNDGVGNPIGSLNGALNIHNADVHTVPINKYFHSTEGVSDSLAVAASIGDTSITAVDGTKFTVGDFIEFGTSPHEAVFKSVTVIVGNVLTLDGPLDNDHVIGNILNIVSLEMNVSGSLTTPISFKFLPDVGSPPWHIVRFLFSMSHDSLGDLGLFGNLPPLVNGVTLRGLDGISGKFRTFMNIKTNSDIKNNMYDVDFDTRSGGGGTFGTSGRGSIKIGTGAVPKLNSANGDYFEILIQDDLTSLLSFRMKVQGHIEGQ